METVDKKIVLELESGSDVVDILIGLMLLRNVTTTEDVKFNDLIKRVTQQANVILTPEELAKMQGK